MMQRIQASSSKMAKSGSSVDVVSKAILEAVTTKSLNLRYLAGKDVEIWLQARKP